MEEKATYRTAIDTLLQSPENLCTLEAEREPVDWREFERMLIPLLNFARKEQGKKPVILPKG